ncbi:MAG: hypothetical protein GEU75_00995 [Dehalococcoidia bacterium]|nr:hypothetical protein [Dehalococcoidia bacterium]
MATTNIAEIIARVQAHGGELTPLADGNIRYRGAPLTNELRTLLHENKAPLIEALGHQDDKREAVESDLSSHDPVACRGCAALIPAGTTLCADCGSKHSPLIRYALELSAVSEERTLRGRTLIALDLRRYPRLELPDGQLVGPGLIAWAPVLREANKYTLQAILRVATRERLRSRAP